MNFSVFSLSDTGLRRENNEDNLLIADERGKEQGQLYAVADGMGGYLAGETASRMVCERLEELYFQGISRLLEQGEPAEDDILFLLEKIIYAIHKEVFNLGSTNHEFCGMGSTLSLLLLRKSRAFIVHVGDSRIYRLRSGKLEQLTEDQTEVQKFVNLGRITPEEAQNHHLSHVLSQAIGGRKDSFSRAWTTVFAVEPRDNFLLCSDGLYDMVSGSDIELILAGYPDGEEACLQLLQLSLDGGGKDNITMVLIQNRPGFLRDSVFGSKMKKIFHAVRQNNLKMIFLSRLKKNL